MTNQNLSFNNVTLTPIPQDDGQIWIASADLAKALGYKQSRAVTKIFNRNANEFNEQMTRINKTPSVPNLGTRIFSLRGCHLIAMFANTPIAKDFRKWVLDILDKQIDQPVRLDVPLSIIPKKDYSDSDLQHLKEVFKIPELAALLGTTEPQAIQRLYQSYPQHTAQSQQLALPNILSRYQALLDKFWQALSQLDLEQINHAKDPQILAINLPQLYQIAGDQLPPKRTMLQALKHSLIPKFLQSNQCIRSDITHDTKKCWVFLQV